MDFSLSTSYFAGQHLAPEAIAEKTLALGFTGVELGYFTRETEIDAWCNIIEQMPLEIKSIHAFCGMPQLGPEVFSFAAPDETARQQAIAAILRA